MELIVRDQQWASTILVIAFLFRHVKIEGETTHEVFKIGL